MTLIIGANLSDRVYLSGDTRVSVDGVKKSDYQHKIIKINDQISVGCAGSLFMANHIVSVMKKNAGVNTGVDEFICLLKEVLPAEVGGHLSKSKIPYDRAGTKILVAGIDRTKKKEIENSGQIVARVGSYQKSLDEAIDKLTNGRKIEDLSPDEHARLGYLVTSKQMNMKEILFRAIQEGRYHEGKLLVPTVYSTLYSIELPQGNPVPRFKHHPWGSVVTAGGASDLEELSNEFFMEIDMNMASGDIARDTLLFVQKTIQHFGNTIGGFVTPVSISERGIDAMFGEILEVKRDGSKVRLFETKIENGTIFGAFPGDEMKALQTLGVDGSTLETTLSLI